MKRIAVIISGIDEEYQSTILRGIHDCAMKHDASVLHFVSFGGILRNAKHDAGEYNIYSLCNYDELDGVILLNNTICEVSVTGDIVNELQGCSVPVVSIDNDLDVRFFHIGIDNYAAMREMVEHVTKHHKCRKIGYISGPESNPESILRFNAFEDVMNEEGIPFSEEQVYYGGFRAVDGTSGALYFLNRPEGLPEAIICANDAMALSAVMELETHGIRVPEDVIVTGFDDIYDARNFDPDITSVERPLYQSGYLAMKRLLGLCDPDNPRSMILDTRCSFRQSCGCKDTPYMQESIREFRRANLKKLSAYQTNVPMINRMSCQLAESDNFNENLRALMPFIEQAACERFYLCLNEDWNELSAKSAEGGQKMQMTESYRTHGYTEKMQVPLVYDGKNFSQLPAFPSAQMLPDPEKQTEEPMLYYFMPLHFRDRGFGYCLFCSKNSTLETPLLHSWVMNIANSLESIRKLEYMEKAMGELDQLYVLDQLCRINNRNGFQKFTADIFEDCRQHHKDAMLMFIDMDRLKYINDTFSHAEGDNALKQLARAIKLSCQKGEVFARFGGDEFVIFAPSYTEEMAQALADQIQQRLQDYSQSSGKPYEVGASIGWHICQIDEDSELYPLITAADKKMYEEKKRKRVSRYIRH